MAFMKPTLRSWDVSVFIFCFQGYGWFFGSSLDGSTVFAHNPAYSGELPPVSGCRIPQDICQCINTCVSTVYETRICTLTV